MGGGPAILATRRSPVACVVLALCLGTAGAVAAAPPDNGIAAKPPNAILAAALAAGKHAHSVHVVGALVNGGTPGKLDLRFVGSGVAGRLVEGGGGADLIVTGGEVYVNGGTKFWRTAGSTTDPAVVKLLANRWIASSAAKGPFAKIASSFRLRSFLQALGSSHGKLALGGRTKIQGHPAVALKDTTQGGALYIATTGRPFPLSIQEPKGAGHDSGTVYFEGWNAQAPVKAPASFLDLDKLKKP